MTKDQETPEPGEWTIDELRKAIAKGISQADRGVFVEFTAEDVIARRRSMTERVAGDRSSIDIRVLFFGPAKDLSGVESAELNLEQSAHLAALRKELSRAYPRLGRALSNMRLAVNNEFARDELPLKDGDEVAVIPPVSGG